MAWKETYTTKTGEKRYRVGWRRPDGSKVSKSFTRSKDADTFAVEQERKERLGELWEDTPVTFGDFWEGWKNRYQSQVRPGSFKRRMETKGYLTELWPLHFDQITPSLVEDIVMPLATEHPRQAQYVMQTIKMLLRSARVRGQRINSSVLDMKPPIYESRRKRFLTMDQVDALAEESDCPGLIRFAALTGLRFIELSGLTRADVALGERAVLIHREITKTAAGVRRIPLGHQARTLLREALLGAPVDAQRVFPAPHGGRMSYANFYNRQWVPARNAFGMPDLDFHDLRHTYASLMIAAGVHPRVLKDLMGHESIKLTMDTYGHLYEGAADAAVEALDVFLRRDDDADAAAGADR